MKIEKVAVFGAGAIAAITSGFLLTYPWLFLAQGIVFLWMFFWGFFFGKREETARLKTIHAKKH